MRNFFTKLLNRKLYKVLSVIMAVIWTALGALVLVRGVLRVYVYPLKYKEEVLSACEEFYLEPCLIFAMIKTESGFRASAESNKGALGLMQMTAQTGEYVAQKMGVEEFDLKDAVTNINFGCYYLRYLITRFNNVNTALTAYNAGEGNVSAWLKDKKYSLDGVTLNEIPFPETSKYVKKINRSLLKYRKLYGNILDKQKKFS